MLTGYVTKSDYVQMANLAMGSLNSQARIVTVSARLVGLLYRLLSGIRALTRCLGWKSEELKGTAGYGVRTLKAARRVISSSVEVERQRSDSLPQHDHR